MIGYIGKICQQNQGILKGEVSLYCRPSVWLVWIQLYDKWQICFYFQNRLIQTSQTGGQWYSDTSPFSIPWQNRQQQQHDYRDCSVGHCNIK